MRTVNNNGKLHTNNIYLTKLIFLFFSLIMTSATAMRNEKGWIIVIDAGHGGKDPGAVTSLSRESDITLAIALKTGEYLEKNIKNVTVIYTRKNDTFIELRERPDIANKNKADLFISIHANWAKSKNIQGTETFIMGLAKDEQNLEVAMKENEVILLENDHSTKYEGFDPKSPESYIMFTLMQNIFQEQSTDLASKIQSQFKEKINRTDRGVKQAGFWVLFMTTMPSVLTETGFITNPAEEKFLNSKTGQDYLASAIFRACRDYIFEIESKSVILTGKNQNPERKENVSRPIIPTEGEIIFMVQIATSSEKIEIKPENFKGLTDVVEIDTKNGFRYATGSFTDYSPAFRYRKKIEVVYPDAFVIAVKDNKMLPLQQALEQKKKK
ncbi:MAG: N-acetylmuramoyl-L-alanine amidase [Bacteroidota bacterium]